MPSDDAQGSTDVLPSGTQLGRYQIVRLIGHGGMASVYEAIHLDLKKRVAVKTLRPTVAASAEARARFLREGEAASRIRHPNVVDVTDVGTADGTVYLVMEFLEGEDLAAMIDRVGAMPIADALDVALPVVGAMVVAHEEGVIHRDLKPGNVFMARTRHGGPKPTVLDFGISKLSSSGGSSLGLTGTGAAMGTPYYIAPEQVRDAANADERSDQYALGAILYECVTGRRAHEGESIYEVIRSVCEGTFKRPRAHRPDIPAPLEEAILRAMQLDPARRFPSVQAFGRALLPLASPAAAAIWAPALAGGGDGPRVVPLRTPVAGGTPPNTTLGSGVGHVISPNPRRRTGLIVGGLALLAGGAVGFHFLFASPPRTMTGGARRPAVDDVAAAAPRDPERSPRRFRVAVTVVPENARIDLDDKTIGAGRIDVDLSADGVEHTLTISAARFRPATFTFRDHSPPSRVTLEPLPPPEPGVASSSRGAARPGRTKHNKHEGGRRKSLDSPPIMD